MFLIFRQITVVKFLLYSLIQTIGAFVGAALAYLVYKGNSFNNNFLTNLKVLYNFII